MVRCEYCSQRIDDGINVCPYCGAPLPVPDCSQVSGEVSSEDTSKAENEVSYGAVIGSAIAALGGAVLSGDRMPPAGKHRSKGPGPGHRPMDGRGMRSRFTVHGPGSAKRFDQHHDNDNDIPW